MFYLNATHPSIHPSIVVIWCQSLEHEIGHFPWIGHQAGSQCTQAYAEGNLKSPVYHISMLLNTVRKPDPQKKLKKMVTADKTKT